MPEVDIAIEPAPDPYIDIGYASGQDGSFRIGVASGIYELTIGGYSGYHRLTKTVEIGSGETVRVELTLSRNS